MPSERFARLPRITQWAIAGNVILLFVLSFYGLFVTYHSSSSAAASSKSYPSSVDLSRVNETEQAKPYAPYSECAKVSRRELERLHRLRKHAITVYHEGDLLHEDSVLKAPVRLCLLATMAQERPPYDIFSDAPIPGKGPDTIHLLINTTEVQMTFPPLLPSPAQPISRMQYSDRSVIYYAEPYFLQNGTYDIHAEQEWRNWKWAQEWFHVDSTDSFGYQTGPPDGGISVSDIFRDHAWHNYTIESHRMFPPYIQIAPPDVAFEASSDHKPTILDTLPWCDDQVTAAEGRWYRADTLPNVPKELIDEWGYTWHGDKCRMQFFTPRDVVDCLADKTLHFYGASNARRLTKMVLSGGGYCQDLYDECQINDGPAELPIDKMVVGPRGQMHKEVEEGRGQFWAGRESVINFGKNSSMWFIFTTSITNSTALWMDKLYEPGDLINTEGGPQDRLVKPGAAHKAHQPKDRPKADFVYVNTGAWDSVNTDTVRGWEAGAARYRDAIAAAYKGVPTALHVSPMYCCRETDVLVYRRYTGSRLQAYDDVARQVFDVQGSRAMNDTMVVLDPVNMNGRPEVIWDYGPSPANHLRANHIRIELQMLMNSICVKENGTAKFRYDKKPDVPPVLPKEQEIPPLEGDDLINAGAAGQPPGQ